MFNSMRIGLTGLRATQSHLDVIGNNLTNSETFGYKSDRMSFADAFYRNFGSGSAPGASLGGTNGTQIGLGVQIGSVDHLVSQGDIIQTGRSLDMALQGRGFFVLSDGQQQYFSRVGTFALDSAGNMVDGRTGLKVQDLAGADIVIDQDMVLPAQPTTSLQFAGNLPAIPTGPLAEVQESAAPFADHQPPQLSTTGIGAGTVNLANQDLTLRINGGSTLTVNFPASATGLSGQPLVDAINVAIGTLGLSNPPVASLNGTEVDFLGGSTGPNASFEFGGAAATSLGIAGQLAEGSGTTAVGTTLINDLNANATDYVDGDQIRITGVNSDGDSVSSTFTFGAANDGTTLDDLITAVQTAFPDTTVQLSGGALQVTSNTTGENPLEIVLQDALSNTGASNFSTYALAATQEGTGPDTRTSTITIYDSLGASHTITGTFERQEDGTWNLGLSIPEDEGTISTGSPITGITFDSDGSFVGAGGLTLDVGWSNGAAAQSVTLDLGETGGFSGLTQTAAPASAQFEAQDGYPSGTLTGFEVTGNGVIRGNFSNNQSEELAQLGIARFRNAEGLVKEGGTMFRRGENAGEPIIGGAQENGSGTIVGGALEGSNVDTAEEFVKLIEAQRTFQGASRVISTADELFIDLLQIV
jgi:flagellar hook protein FlgE